MGLTYDKFDIVFQEVPDEISLAISICECQNNCEGCHSAHLRKKGKKLSIDLIEEQLSKYPHVTTVLFLGEGNHHNALVDIIRRIKLKGYKVALYSGRDIVLQDFIELLDYYKVGSYNELLGGLDSEMTNQVMYKISKGWATDITDRFRK